ncbi:MAG: hypothetical protein AAF039_10050 [Bacteroidota bacterium]
MNRFVVNPNFSEKGEGNHPKRILMAIRNGLDGVDAEKFIGFQEIENQPRLFCLVHIIFSGCIGVHESRPLDFFFGQCKKEMTTNRSFFCLSKETNQRKDPFFGRNFCYAKPVSKLRHPLKCR